MLALLVPFIALLATSIVASFFAPHDQWLYFLKVVAVGGALWRYRRVYACIAYSAFALALAVGRRHRHRAGC